MSNDYPTIPYDIVVRAKCCDEEALGYILRHFSSYIKRLALVSTTDTAGNKIFVVDEDIVSQLQAKLIMSIINDFQL